MHVKLRRKERIIVFEEIPQTNESGGERGGAIELPQVMDKDLEDARVIKIKVCAR